MPRAYNKFYSSKYMTDEHTDSIHIIHWIGYQSFLKKFLDIPRLSFLTCGQP